MKKILSYVALLLGSGLIGYGARETDWSAVPPPIELSALAPVIVGTTVSVFFITMAVSGKTGWNSTQPPAGTTTPENKAPTLEPRVRELEAKLTYKEEKIAAMEKSHSAVAGVWLAAFRKSEESRKKLEKTVEDSQQLIDSSTSEFLKKKAELEDKYAWLENSRRDLKNRSQSTAPASKLEAATSREEAVPPVESSEPMTPDRPWRLRAFTKQKTLGFEVGNYRNLEQAIAALSSQFSPSDSAQDTGEYELYIDKQNGGYFVGQIRTFLGVWKQKTPLAKITSAELPNELSDNPFKTLYNSFHVIEQAISRSFHDDTYHMRRSNYQLLCQAREEALASKTALLGYYSQIFSDLEQQNICQAKSISSQRDVIDNLSNERKLLQEKLDTEMLLRQESETKMTSAQAALQELSASRDELQNKLELETQALIARIGERNELRRQLELQGEQRHEAHKRIEAFVDLEEKVKNLEKSLRVATAELNAKNVTCAQQEAHDQAQCEIIKHNNATIEQLTFDIVRKDELLAYQSSVRQKSAILEAELNKQLHELAQRYDYYAQALKSTREDLACFRSQNEEIGAKLQAKLRERDELATQLRDLRSAVSSLVVRTQGPLYDWRHLKEEFNMLIQL